MSCCLYHERWYTYIFQTERWAHTLEEQWSVEGNLVGVSSSCLLYRGQLQGYRAATGPLQASDGCRTQVQDNLHHKNNFKFSLLLFLYCALYLSTITHTFSSLRTLQPHDFLLHFLLSTGFRELSRIWLVASEYGKSGLYSDSETRTHTCACML